MNLSPAQLNSGRDKQYYSPVWLTNKLGNNVSYFRKYIVPLPTELPGTAAQFS